MEIREERDEDREDSVLERTEEVRCKARKVGYSVVQSEVSEFVSCEASEASAAGVCWISERGKDVSRVR